MEGLKMKDMIEEQESGNRERVTKNEEMRVNLYPPSKPVSTIAFMQKGMLQGTEADNKAFTSFVGWFNNRMMVILMLIQDIRPRESRSMLRAEFFLEEIERHFISPSADRTARNAFRWMRRYLKIYPAVTKEHSKRALDKVSQIYDAVADGCGPMRNPVWDIKRRLNCSGNFERRSGVIVRTNSVCRVA